ncbi:MAG: L,D-transpeptidase family protein [Caulobacterales bacterium]
MAAPHAIARPASSNRSIQAVNRQTPILREALKDAGLNLGAPVFLRTTKQPAILELFVKGADGRFVSFRRYPICAASGDLGPKLRVGDGQAPEGFYFVTDARMNPYSSYHLSFDLGYPNAFDRAHGRTGSALMVHGNCVSIGCYAMGDDAIEEIWTLMIAAFAAGQTIIRVHAFPFAMTKANLDAHAKDPNADFWANLKEGWDWFETQGQPPNVGVRNDGYTFSAS